MNEPEHCMSMTEVRAELDALDQEIAGLLAKRFRFIDAAARIKQSRDQIRDEKRISAVIDRVRSNAMAAGAPAEVIAKIYESLIEASIAYELDEFDARQS